jgi:[phosphatase 2A protein]-leucine-carboxy methyltransferase
MHPLILLMKGTYVRTRSIDRLIEAALESTAQTALQIVSLGAGTDTRFFNLQVLKVLPA